MMVRNQQDVASFWAFALVVLLVGSFGYMLYVTQHSLFWIVLVLIALGLVYGFTHDLLRHLESSRKLERLRQKGRANS